MTFATESFYNGRIVLHGGDCREVVKTLPPNSLDSLVSDTPYALTSIVKRFGQDGAAPAQEGADGRYTRLSRGFMGHRWDTGEVAHDPAFWRDWYRVLKPGAHVAVMGGTRTFHRLVTAVEDAGFEVRDTVLNVIDPDAPVVAFMESLSEEQLRLFVRCMDDQAFGGLFAWMYATGFPKSHDLSKGIDGHLFGLWLDEDPTRRAAYREEMQATKKFRSDAKRCEAKEAVEAKWRALGGFLRSVIGERRNNKADSGPQKYAALGTFEQTAFTEITAAATGDAFQWQGWGTALKPAFEPICIARKPLGESTVAANVLRWRTGALNIDACRVQPDASHGNRRDSKSCTCSLPKVDQKHRTVGTRNQASSAPSHVPQNGLPPNAREYESGHPSQQDLLGEDQSFDRLDGEPVREAGGVDQARFQQPRGEHTPLGRCPVCGGIRGGLSNSYANTAPNFEAGRWPANLITDGSEVVADMFPISAGQLVAARCDGEAKQGNVYGKMHHAERVTKPRNDGNGSAVRFYYSAKATKSDRAGSKHPTIKPVGLKQWLVRLTTPPGGITADPFAGTGTTGEAAVREGMRCIMVEREESYREDIRRRMTMVFMGPEERARASIAPAPVEALPLWKAPKRRPEERLTNGHAHEAPTETAPSEPAAPVFAPGESSSERLSRLRAGMRRLPVPRITG